MSDLLKHTAWIAVGVVSAAMSVVLKFKAHALDQRASHERPRTYARRRGKLQAEITSRAILLPLAVMLFVLAAIYPPPEVRRVSGKPVEMRSWSRLVIMPDGGYYTFSCGSRGSRCSRSEVEIWNRLPRWPEPNHVEMLVSGHEINSLEMDGQVLVDRPPADERVGFVLIGVGVLAYATITIALRLRRLRKIPSRVKSRLRTGASTP